MRTIIRIKVMILCLLSLVTILSAGGRADVFGNIDISKELIYNNSSLYSSGGLNQGNLYLKDLYIRIDGDKLGELIIGRYNKKIGPGYFSQLMLSDTNSLNLVYYENEYEFFNMPFFGQMLVSSIDPSINKQLFVHRISTNTLIPGLEVGFSESMIGHEKIHPAYYLPVPFWPYYLTTKLVGISSDYNYYDDKYIGLDFTYNCFGGHVYGELLVDEHPQGPSNPNPVKRAHLIGVKLPVQDQLNIRFEYSNVFNYVYVHRFPENVYAYKGTSLGHWLGPDSEVTDLELEQLLAQGRFSLGVRYIRKGTGNLDKDYGADHEEKRFLSEINNRNLLLRLGYEHDLNKYMRINLSTEYGKSFKETTGSSDNLFMLNVNVRLEL